MNTQNNWVAADTQGNSNRNLSNDLICSKHQSISSSNRAMLLGLANTYASLGNQASAERCIRKAAELGGLDALV